MTEHAPHTPEHIGASVPHAGQTVLSPSRAPHARDSHPVIVILTLLAGASLGGLVGMLLAIPVAGTIKVTWNYFTEKAGWDKPTPDDLDVIGIHLGHTRASHDADARAGESVVSDGSAPETDPDQ